MKQPLLKLSSRTLPSLLKNVLIVAPFLAATSVSAQLITLTPLQIHGGDTTTASFSNADLTITPTRGGVSDGITFNADAVRLGIDGFPGQGENPNAFSEADDIFGNGNEEGFILELSESVSLTQIAFDFSSFAGSNPTDGLQISGFVSDPGASLAGFGAGNAGNTVTFADGTVTVIFTNSFGDPETFLNFENLEASSGQTLTATVGDSIPASISQLAVISISYVSADQDGDGIRDEDEAAVGGDPTLFDTDGDGFSDGFELAAGTLLNDPSSNSAPPVSGRESIGVTFTAANGDAPNRTLSPLAAVGADGFVQTNWNSTTALPATGIYSQTDIATPVAGTLVDNAGNNTGVTFTTSVFGQPDELTNIFSADSDVNQPIGGLFSGYVFANVTTSVVNISLTDIPYERYDLVVYGITNTGNPAEATRISVFEGTEQTDAILGGFTLSSAPRVVPGAETTFFQTRDQSDPFTLRGQDSENFPRANYMVFRGLTDASPVIDIAFVNSNFGVPAFQIVNAPDSDGDGLGDAFEVSVGLDPNDDGSIDSVREGADGDFDGDGISNLAESLNETNPGEADSDFDGLSDDQERDTANFVSVTDRGTDPNIADTDEDGLSDSVETNTGVFVDATDTGTNPLDALGDSDGDAFPDAFEVANNSATQPFDPFDEDIPGGPNPNGFAVAFDSTTAQAGAVDVPFPGTVYVGAPGVEQRNWNRTIPQAANLNVDGGLVTFGIENIASPVAGQLSDSSGAPLTGVDFNYTPGSGFFALNNSGVQQVGTQNFVGPFGRLFNSYAFGSNGTASSESRVTFDNIPYESYDAYVYFGSFFESPGTVSTFDTAGVVQETFSYTTTRTELAASQFALTEQATGNPRANYAVFRNQTSPSLDVRSDFTDPGASTNIGIFGVQIVDTTVVGGVELTLVSPTRVGSLFSVAFTSSADGTFQLQRSLSLEDGFVSVGSPFSASAGEAMTVSDPSSPDGRAFYRVIQVDPNLNQ